MLSSHIWEPCKKSSSSELVCKLTHYFINLLEKRKWHCDDFWIDVQKGDSLWMWNELLSSNTTIQRLIWSGELKNHTKSFMFANVAFHFTLSVKATPVHWAHTHNVPHAIYSPYSSQSLVWRCDYIFPFCTVKRELFPLRWPMYTNNLKMIHQSGRAWEGETFPDSCLVHLVLSASFTGSQERKRSRKSECHGCGWSSLLFSVVWALL